MKWSKMMTNLTANPISAILDMTAAEVFANPKLYRLEVEMLCECMAVMKAQGIPVVDLPGTPVRALAFVTRLPLCGYPSHSWPRGAEAGAAGRCRPSISTYIPAGANRKWNFYMARSSAPGRNSGSRRPSIRY